jgi:hypothetical protein
VRNFHLPLYDLDRIDPRLMTSGAVQIHRR